MRYLVGFACVLAALAALPLSVSAQAAEEGATSKPSAEESTPSAEPTPEEPALQLKLDDAGVEVVPSGYVEMKLRQRVSKARAWLIATGVVTAIGVPMLALGATYDRRQPPSEGFDLDFSGAVLATVGGIMVFGGVAKSGASTLRNTGTDPTRLHPRGGGASSEASEDWARRIRRYFGSWGCVADSRSRW